MVGGSKMKDPELVIQYFPDSDTLRLGTGTTPAEGETIAKWLMVEWSRDEEVTGVVLRNAAKVLRPYLFPDGEKPDTNGDAKRDRPSAPRATDNLSGDSIQKNRQV